jgi:hypothetical protein
MSEEDWSEVGDRVCGILAQVYGERRPFFEQQAQRRAIRLEQLAAAAIQSMIRECLENASGRPRRGQRDG